MAEHDADHPGVRDHHADLSGRDVADLEEGGDRALGHVHDAFAVREPQVGPKVALGRCEALQEAGLHPAHIFGMLAAELRNRRTVEQAAVDLAQRLAVNGGHAKNRLQVLGRLRRPQQIARPHAAHMKSTKCLRKQPSLLMALFGKRHRSLAEISPLLVRDRCLGMAHQQHQ